MADEKTVSPASGADAGSAAGLRLWTNDVDTFVAGDRDDLRRVFEEHYGASMEDVTGNPKEIEEWGEIPPDRLRTIYWALDDLKDQSVPEGAKVERLYEPPNPDWSHEITATAQAWANFHGRGFLCSTEW